MLAVSMIAVQLNVQPPHRILALTKLQRYIIEIKILICKNIERAKTIDSRRRIINLRKLAIGWGVSKQV